MTKARDELSAKVRALPMEKVNKCYSFSLAAASDNDKTAENNNPSKEDGKVSLLDLFQGRKQLIVYHFMLGPDAEEGCVGCSFLGDHIPHLSHLRSMNTNLVFVSRSPPEKLAAFRERMGWTQVPWYSSLGSDFNYDFQATQDESVHEIEYNYDDKATMEAKGLKYNIKGEQPGLSVFLRGDDGKVYHTYSTYARGLDSLLITNGLLDVTPLGRQAGISEFKHHDKY